MQISNMMQLLAAALSQIKTSV